MTLVSLYTELLLKDNIRFDVIYIDRYGLDADFPAYRQHAYKSQVSQLATRRDKLIDYARFRQFAQRIIDRNQYDFLVVWNETTATLFSDYLVRRWDGRYSLNIRDHLGFSNPVTSRMLGRAIRGAAFTTISSDRFRSFLPPGEYLHIHSYNRGLLSQCEPQNSFREDGWPIRIAFIGNVRFIPENQHLLSTFANDHRFELHYHGANSERLADYASARNIKNAQFSGIFSPDYTCTLLKTADILNSYFGSGRPSVDTLLPIRLYQGAHNRLPVLATAGTYMGSVIERNGLGFIADGIDAKTPGLLYDWYRSLDFRDFEQSCATFMKEVTDSHATFEETLRRSIGEQHG